MRQYDRERIDLKIASPDDVQKENSFFPESFIKQIDLKASGL